MYVKVGWKQERVYRVARFVICVFIEVIIVFNGGINDKWLAIRWLIRISNILAILKLVPLEIFSNI